jgi:hypothetical protein
MVARMLGRTRYAVQLKRHPALCVKKLVSERELRLGSWRRKTTRFRNGAYSGTQEVAEPPSQVPNGSTARLRAPFSRDERA